MKTDAMHDGYHPDCDPVLHCAIHMVDEPDGEYACLECSHSWATWDDLLKDHNSLMREMGLPEETTSDKIWTCPHCAHDF